MSYTVQTKDLSKAFGKCITVDKVNMHVMKGDIYGFIGQNGAGKTTTIRMILNLIKPSGGTVELFGEEVTDKTIYKYLKKIGAIIETPGFYPNLTGEDNLDIHRIMMGISDKISVDRAMKIVGLSDQEGKKTRYYSLGMRQRLGIARALLPYRRNIEFAVSRLSHSGRCLYCFVEAKASQARQFFSSFCSCLLSRLPS